MNVVHYEVALEPDVASASLRGAVTIHFTVAAETSRVAFDSGALTIDAVSGDGTALPFEVRDRRTTITLARLARPGERRAVEIRYHGAPRRGVQFSRAPEFVFTVFSTSEWMVCVDAPSDRATLDLRLSVPVNYRVVGNGREQESAQAPGGRVERRWVLDRAAPTYTYGFAAGEFAAAELDGANVPMTLLGAGLSAAELRQVFPSTREMIAFFEARAGVPYPGSRYTQVIAGRGVGQEMTDFSVFPDDYARTVLRDGEGMLGAHELAHQWWGNGVTCADFTHFWLNEGFATFMAAAFVEQKGGRSAYAERISAARARYEAVRRAGNDRPLIFRDWTRPTADDRTIVYQKGAFVLSLLREQLGEALFWKGIADYTRAYMGRPVVTDDFKRAMEQSSGKDLTAFFNEWVYGRKDP